jgi:hypothetical protein
MTRLAAALIDLAWADTMHLVDQRTGEIMSMSMAEYEALPDSDPRLSFATHYKRRALTESLRVRGIDCGQAVQRY